MAHDPQKPDVVERGVYSDTKTGPNADSAAFETGTPMGHDRLEESHSARTAAATAAGPVIPRDALARTRAPAGAAERPSRPPSIGAGLGVAGVIAAVAAWTLQA